MAHPIFKKQLEWVKNTPIHKALCGNQFHLSVPLYSIPSSSHILCECVTKSINVSDIVYSILMSACINKKNKIQELLHQTCALLENYKHIALENWPDMTAGEMAHRAIVYTMKQKGLGIIGDKLQYSILMGSISLLCTELQCSLDQKTTNVFSGMSPVIFDVPPFSTYTLTFFPMKESFKKNLFEYVLKKGLKADTIDTALIELHASTWGDAVSFEEFNKTLIFINVISRSVPGYMKDIYLAGMAMSGYLCSHEMISSALNSANIDTGVTVIKDYLYECNHKPKSQLLE